MSSENETPIRSTLPLGSTLPLCLYGRTSVYEFLGDYMVFRGLNAYDDRLPGLKELQSRSGLPGGFAPRKHEAEYAQLVSILLHMARQIDAPKTSLKRIIFIGDTRMSDVGAFQNLCQAGGWDGMVFIGSEEPKPAKVEITPASPHPVISDQTLYLANRWALIDEFDRYIQGQKFAVDESTVVIVDLDKTALGGRGRNSAVIDRARVLAVRQTVAGLLGDSFDPAVFQTNYERLNKPEFHGFTADNQDFLAYICLVLGAGIESSDELIARIRASGLTTFDQFIQQIEQQKYRLPSALGEIHSEIYSQFQAGDPTPLKNFAGTNIA